MPAAASAIRRPRPTAEKVPDWHFAEPQILDFAWLKQKSALGCRFASTPKMAPPSASSLRL